MAENEQLQDKIKEAIDAKKVNEGGSEKKEEVDKKEIVDEKKESVTDETKKEEDGKESGTEKKEDAKEETETAAIIKITAKQEEKKEETTTPDEDDIDEAKLIAALEKRTGKKFTSLDEIVNPKKELTEEEKTKAKEQRDANKIAFGLQNGLVTEKKLTKYFADSKNKQALVFEQYWEQASSEDKALTKADAEIEFKEKFNLDEEPDSRKYKRGLQEINSLADQIIRNEYPEVFELERNYVEHEKGLTTTQQKEATIIQKTPLYKKDVEVALDEIKTIKVSRTDEKTKQTEEFNIDIDKSILEPYKKQMLEKEYAESQILKGWNKEEIKARYQGAAILENLGTIVFDAIDQAMLKREKGLKGVQPSKEFNARQEQKIESVKEKVKADLEDRFKNTTEKAAQAN